MRIQRIQAGPILQLAERFERFIVFVLLVSLMAVVLLGTIGLIWMICATIYEKAVTIGFADANFTMPLLHEVFTGFLMILIGLELMKTIMMYLDDHVVHVEVVLSVALIAIARHVIDLDLKAASPLSLIGTASIIFALAIGYYYFNRTIAGSNEMQTDGKSE
jgi:uncharacterized membrane protein (DUF373 family)